MAYDYEDDLSHSQNRVGQPPEGISTSYQVALGLWFGPAIVAGLLMTWINLRTYNTVGHS